MKHDAEVDEPPVGRDKGRTQYPGQGVPASDSSG